MKKMTPYRLLAFLVTALILSLGFQSRGAFVIDSLTGAVTANEISNFKSTMNGWSVPSGEGNQWLFSSPAFQCYAMSRMYEITGDTSILDRLILWTDSTMAARNDPNTGMVLWTGRRELTWPEDTNSIYSASGGGEHVNHILTCAKLILQTPSIWNTTIASGDPHGYGATYKARALKYLELCDQTIDGFIIGVWVDPSQSDHFIYPSNWGGSGGSPGNGVPWNQQSMFVAALQRSSECHEILGDDPARVAYQDSICTSAVNWFLSDCVAYTASSKSCYYWYYSDGTTTKYEEVWENHGALDIRMLCETYMRGIGLSKTEMTKFANTMQYSVWNGSIFHGRFDGADGSYGTQTHTKGFYTMLGDFLPALYTTIATANQSQTSDTEAMTYLLWMKDRNYQQFALSGSASSGISISPGGSATYDVGVSPLGGFSGTVSLSASGLPTGVTATYTPASISGASGVSSLQIDTATTTPTGSYNLTVTGTSGSKVQSGTIPLYVPSGSPLTGNRVIGRTASTSSDYSAGYDGSKAIDGDTNSRWAAATGTSGDQWLTVDFGSLSRFASVIIKEIYAQRVSAYKLQSSMDGVTFQDIPGTTGTTIGTARTVSFEPVSARYIRLYIIASSSNPTINEFEVYSDIAQGATATASTTWSSSYDAGHAADGSEDSRWSASSGSVNNQWLLIDFGSATSYGRVIIKEIYAQRVTAFKLQSSSNGTTFSDISGASGTTIGADKTVTFTPVSARYIRLFLTSSSTNPTINEFEVFTK
jgi:hypothetical protein